MGRCIGGQYPPEQVDRALIALIRIGNANKAAEALNTSTTDPLGVSASTLRQWRTDTYRDRYHELHEQHAPAIEAEAVHNARELVALIAEKERDVIARLNPEALDQRDIASTLRNLSTSKSLQVDKAILPLTGRDIAGRTERGPDELIHSLKQAAPHLFATPTTAHAEVVDDESEANQPVPKREAHNDTRAIGAGGQEATRTQ